MKQRMPALLRQRKNNFGIKNGGLGSQSKKGTAVKDNQENTNKSRVKGPSE